MTQQADFYKSVLDEIIDGVYFVDREKRITYWNKSAEELSGYSREEVAGRCCSDNILVHIDETGISFVLPAVPFPRR